MKKCYWNNDWYSYSESAALKEHETLRHREAKIDKAHVAEVP